MYNVNTKYIEMASPILNVNQKRHQFGWLVGWYYWALSYSMNVYYTVFYYPAADIARCPPHYVRHK